MKYVKKVAALVLCGLLSTASLTLPIRAADLVNLALNKQVTSSSIEGNNVASLAVDGNENTFWAAKNPSELEVDLAGYYKVSSINLMAYFPPAVGVDRFYEYEIYGSVDQKEYTKLCENKGGDFETPEGTDFVINPITVRYVKVKILRTNAVGQPQNNTGHIKELRVYGEVDESYEQPVIKTNVALNKQAYASSNEEGHPASMAIDNNIGSYWSSAGESYLEVDLGGYYDVDEINIIPYYSDGRFYHYEIYTSIDGLEYHKVAEKLNDDKQTADGDTYHLDMQTIRYVKVNMLHNSANTSMHICELRVMGTENTEYVPPEVPEDKENIAAKKATRSYFNDVAYPASAINDGDLRTKWQPAYYPGYVDIDLEENYDLHKIQVFPDYSDGSTYYQYSIFGSMDGSQFYPIAEKQSKDSATKDGNTFNIDNIEARIIRVYLENVSKGNTGRLNEVRVYGASSSTEKQERPDINVSDFEETEYASPISDEESLEAARGVLKRTIGEKYLDWFAFVLEDKADAQQDYYEISNVDGKIQIKGNKGLSLTTGLNYYLKYYCNVSITQQARQVHMPDAIVPVDETIYKETPYAIRYAYNFCTHSYTMAFWGETEWQNEMDYLALNGFNAILDVTGAEEVYRRFLNALGYNNDEAKDWLVGPAYYGWQYMANMENVNGPIPDGWFADRTELARKNQRHMRALGMTPILQGYSGMVPNSIQSKDADAVIIPQGTWNGMQRPAMLKTTSETFDKYAEIFYRVQREVYGDDAHYYATDPFHEGGNTGGIGRDIVGRRVLDQMKTADAQATWVIQSWSFDPSLLKNITAEEKLNNILLLDLNATKDARYASTNEFDSSNWVYCMLENYGGRSGIAGNLKKYTSIPSQIKDKTKYMKGIGISPEGTNNNPVKYELFLEMMWEDKDINLETWIDHYVERRYGSDSTSAKKAWDLLLETAYMNNSSHADPPESIMNVRPQFDATKSAPNGNINIHYSKQKFEKAIHYLMEDYDTLKNSEGYLYDVTDFLRQGIANSAQNEYSAFTGAFKDKDDAKFKESSQRFLNMIELQDKVLNANEHFMVGTWLAPSLQAAEDQDAFTKKIFEMNSKALITTWAPYYCWGVYDYANREYGGLTKDYYLKRWQIWVDRLSRKLKGENVKTDFSTAESQQLAWEWARSNTTYPTEATNDLKALYQDFKANYTITDTSASTVDQSNIRVHSDVTNMNETTYALDRMLDGDMASFWSSGYGDQEPYDIYFEFDQPYRIHKFAQLPRPGGGNGNILGIELYASDDGVTYTKIAEDTYANTASEKVTEFAPITTKYIKLHIRDFLIYNDNHDIKSVTCAEVNFYKTDAGLSSDVYTFKNGFVNGVKEDTAVGMFVKQLNIPEGRSVQVQRDGTILHDDDIIQEHDIVKLMNKDTVVEEYKVAALVKKPDFTELNALIKLYESLIESDYTVDSWKIFDAQLTLAIGVQVNPEATAKEIEEAVVALRDAHAQLVSIQVLYETIAKASTHVSKDYTQSSFDALVSAIAEAQKVIENPKATAGEVQAALATLKSAENNLVTIVHLKAMIASASALIASDYTVESFAHLTKALVDAEAVLSQGTQTEVDQAAEAISIAIKQLEFVHEDITTTLLTYAITKALDIQKNNLLENLNIHVIENFNQALKAAVAALDNPESTSEVKLDAWFNLATAMHYLDFKADKTQLSALIDTCINMDLTLYQETGKQEFEAALEQAKSVLASDDVLDATIMTAYNRLLDAKSKLILLDDIQKTVLLYVVQQAEIALSKANYYEQNTAWNVFVDMLTQAKIVLETAILQSEVDVAATKLSDAYENIRFIANEERLEALQAFIAKMHRMNLANYNAEQNAVMMDAMTLATDLFNKQQFTWEEYNAFVTMSTKVEAILNAHAMQPESDISPTESKKPGEITRKDEKQANIIAATGDATQMGWILGLMIIAFGALMVVKRKRKKIQ